MKKSFSVAGINFVPEAAQLRPAGLVEIVPDPANKFDPLALAVVWQGTRIGFVPGPRNKATPTIQAEIHAMLKATPPVPFVAEVTGFRYRDGETWNDGTAGKLGSVEVQISEPGQSDIIVKDGKQYGRISKLVGCFHPDGIEGLMKWAINKFKSSADYAQYMDRVAGEGTAMHAAMEHFFRTGGERKAELPAGLDEFLKTRAIAPITFEARVFDEATLMSGQFDMYASVNGELTVLDWKSSKSVREHHKLQASWYAKQKAVETGQPVRPMVVAWGADPVQVWHGTHEQAVVGAAIVDRLIACKNWMAKLA